MRTFITVLVQFIKGLNPIFGHETLGGLEILKTSIKYGCQQHMCQINIDSTCICILCYCIRCTNKVT